MLDLSVLSSDIGKLLIAALVGGVVGFERENNGQAAGLRTNIIVSVGSCLMMLLSLEVEKLYHGVTADGSVVRVDPGRIASYAIASMGFLGAGAIIKGKGTVRGLTTAASLWVVTGMGLSIGAGFYAQTIAATVIVMIALYYLHPLRELTGFRIYSILTLKFKDNGICLEAILSEIKAFPTFTVINVSLENDLEEGRSAYRIRLFSRDKTHWQVLLAKLSGMQGLLDMRWEESDVP